MNDEKPHNPLINSGHLLTCSSMFAGERADRKFENYTKIVSKMIQSAKPDYNHEMCLAEMMKAHKNYCLLYQLQEKGLIAEYADIESLLSFTPW